MSIGVIGQQDDRSHLKLSIQKVSPTTFGYDVSVKIENTGAKAVSLALSHTGNPTFQSLGIQQWDKKQGWQSVRAVCLDVPPSTTRRLQGGETVDDIVPIGDASHGSGSTVCPIKVWQLGGQIRAALCFFDSDEQFQNRITTPCELAISPTVQLPEPLHLAHFEAGPIKLVRPVYPDAAKKSGIHGTVVLDIAVGEDGNVKHVEVVKGPSALVEAAADAVRQWQYRPHVLNGKAVPVSGRVTVKFVLPSTIPANKKPPSM